MVKINDEYILFNLTDKVFPLPDMLCGGSSGLYKFLKGRSWVGYHPIFEINIWKDSFISMRDGYAGQFFELFNVAHIWKGLKV